MSEPSSSKDGTYIKMASMATDSKDNPYEIDRLSAEVAESNARIEGRTIIAIVVHDTNSSWETNH